MTQKITEAQIAEKVVSWLQDQNWDVYQEVCPQRVSGVADIIAIQGSIYWIIEVKTYLGLAVLAQAVRWRGYSHMRAVAIPKSKKDTQTRWFAEHVAKDYGVGIIRVTEHGMVRYVPGDFESKPRLLGSLASSIRPEHKNYAKAGSVGGGYYTEFKGTVERLKTYLKTHPGATMKQVIAEIDHHYSSSRSARATLLKLINEGIIQGIRKEQKGRELTLYLES